MAVLMKHARSSPQNGSADMIFVQSGNHIRVGDLAGAFGMMFSSVPGQSGTIWRWLVLCKRFAVLALFHRPVDVTSTTLSALGWPVVRSSCQYIVLSQGLPQ